MLKARGHAVHLLTFADDPAERAVPDALRALCASVTILPLDRRVANVKALAGVLGRQPLSLRFFSSRAMSGEVERAIATVNPDGIIVYSSSMAQYVPPSYWPRTVTDLVDIDSEKWRDYAEVSREPLASLYRLEWRRLRQYEQMIVRRGAAAVVTTFREALLLDEPGMTFSTGIHVFVNGVDTQFFRPDPVARLSAPCRGRAPFLRGPARRAWCSRARWITARTLTPSAFSRRRCFRAFARGVQMPNS